MDEQALYPLRPGILGRLVSRRLSKTGQIC
jgi:hypothetical protein